MFHKIFLVIITNKYVCWNILNKYNGKGWLGKEKEKESMCMCLCVIAL